MIDQFLNMFLQNPIWGLEVLSNSLRSYVEMLAYFVIWLLVFKIITSVIVARVKLVAVKTEGKLDDQILEVIDAIKPPFYFYVAFYLAVQSLHVHHLLARVFDALLILAIVYQVIKVIRVLVEYALTRKFGNEEIKTKSAASMLGKLISGALWMIGLVLILSNMGVDVTSLIAGLGIGGLAVALALQNILGDLFAAFMIYFDKPFEVGDFVVIGDHAGTVRNIGIRSTRIRSLQGEEIVISNKELTSVRIQNFKKLRERRVVVTFGVVYGTSNKKLAMIPKIVKEIIGKAVAVRFDRCNFCNFADSALDFETVFFIDSSDYNEYMDAQEKILLEIKERFEREKIEMAFPTRTIHMQRA